MLARKEESALNLLKVTSYKFMQPVYETMKPRALIVLQDGKSIELEHDLKYVANSPPEQWYHIADHVGLLGLIVKQTQQIDELQKELKSLKQRVHELETPIR